MAEGMIRGWKLPADVRALLLEEIPPRYTNPLADHVTFKPDNGDMPEVDHCHLVGMADDQKGVQALVVSLAGTTERPNGSTYHITWSLAHRRKAKESNDAIRQHGWSPYHRREPIPLVASTWQRRSG